MKKFLCFLFLLPFLLSAQINESDSLKVKASLSLTGFFQQGNVETKIFRGRTDVSVKPWKKWVFKTKNSYVFQEFGGDKADEDILSLNFLYFNPERKLYPQVLGFVSTNFRREIDVRYLMGAGVTYQAIVGLDNWLKFSLTGEFEQTNFSETDFNRDEFDGEQTISTFRGTIWINGQYKILEKKMILTHESYFQPSLENGKNYRWQADIGIELPIWKFISFKVNYLHTFESIVIEGQKEQDRFLTFGVTLKSF
ncbi:DUF481 domain-containing protein [Ekhidna sp.]